MPEEFLKIDFNSRTKTWKSINYPFKDLTNRSVGEAFLESMRSMDPERVLEYHYDVRRERKVKDIYEEAIKVATSFQRLGIQKGDVIVLFSGYSYMTSVLTFGSLLMGAVVNFFEVEFDIEVIVSVFKILKPALILYEEDFRDKLFKCLELQKPSTLKHTFSIDNPNAPNVSSELLKSCGSINFDMFEPLAVDNPQLDVAFLVLTSGSTGVPKAGQLTHSLVLNGMYIWWDNSYNYELPTRDSVIVSLSPLRWISQYNLLLQSAILGIKRICVNRGASGAYGLEILRETKPTHYFSAPSNWYEILLELEEDDVETLKSIVHTQVGGEPPSLAITNLTKKHVVNCRFFYVYGMSEMASIMTSDENLSGGQLVRGYEMQILDDNLQPLGHYQKGQIALKTPYPFIGYKGVDNTKYFAQNDFFINGDYGYFDDQNILYMLGRYKDLIRAQYVTLIPTVVEALTLRIPEVYISRLVGYRRSPEDPWETAALFVELKSDVTMSQKAVILKVREILQHELSEDEMSLICDIYVLKNLPLTSCGKIDRGALQHQAYITAKLSK